MENGLNEKQFTIIELLNEREKLFDEKIKGLEKLHDEKLHGMERVNEERFKGQNVALAEARRTEDEAGRKALEQIGGSRNQTQLGIDKVLIIGLFVVDILLRYLGH